MLGRCSSPLELMAMPWRQANTTAVTNQVVFMVLSLRNIAEYMTVSSLIKSALTLGVNSSVSSVVRIGAGQLCLLRLQGMHKERFQLGDLVGHLGRQILLFAQIVLQVVKFTRTFPELDQLPTSLTDDAVGTRS